MDVTVLAANLSLSTVEAANTGGYKSVIPGTEVFHDRVRTFSTARYSTGAQVGDRIYLIGDLHRRLINNAWWSLIAVLHIPTSSWQWIFCEGAVVRGGQVFLYKDALYMYGDTYRRTPTDFSKFDLTLEEWSDFRVSGRKPHSRSFFSGHFLEERDEFMVFGGSSQGVPRNDIHLFKMIGQSWVQPKVKGNGPSARWQHGSCVHKGVFYCYGGWGNAARLGNGLYLLHFGAKDSVSWSQAVLSRNLPPISSFAMFPFNNLLLFFGGRKSGQGYSHGLSCYNPATGKVKHLIMDQTPNESSHGDLVVRINNGREAIIFGGKRGLNTYILVAAIDKT